MTRREFLQQAAWNGLTLALAACTATSAIAGLQTGESTPAEIGVTLRFHTRSTPQENALYARQMAKYRAQNPTTLLLQEPLRNGEFAEQITALHASGDLGDVLWSSTGQDHLLQAWRQRIIQPLDELVADASIDLSQWYPNCLTSIRRDGQLLGLPFKAHPGTALVYYNQSVFERAGVDLPQAGWTQTQQIELAQRLTAPSVEQYGYLPAYDDLWQTLTTLLPAFGGSLLSADGTTFQLATPPGVAAIRYLHDLLHTYQVAPLPSPTRASASDLWVEGSLAMVQSATRLSALEVVVNEQFAWMVAPNAQGPAGVGGAMCMVDVHSVTTASKAPQAALAWVKFLCNHDSGLQLGLLGGTSGARPDVYGAPELLQFPYRRVFQQVMEQASIGCMTANGHQAAAERHLQRLLAPLWQGMQQPTAYFVEAVAAEVQGVLDLPLATEAAAM